MQLFRIQFSIFCSVFWINLKIVQPPPFPTFSALPASPQRVSKEKTIFIFPKKHHDKKKTFKKIEFKILARYAREIKN